jgi:MFS family permease
VISLLVAAIALLFVKNRPSDYDQVPDGVASNTETRAGYISSVYRTRERWSIRQATGTVAFWLIGFAAVGESAPSTAAIAHAVPHLRDLGHSSQAAASALGVFAVMSIVGKLVAGYLCDRVEPRYVWSACILMMGSAVLIATHAHADSVMYLFTGMLGFGSGGALTCWHTTVANYFGATALAAVLGAQMPFSNAMAAASPFLVGVIYDAQHSYTQSFYAIATLSFVAALLLFTAAPPAQRARFASKVPCL